MSETLETTTTATASAAEPEQIPTEAQVVFGPEAELPPVQTGKTVWDTTNQRWCDEAELPPAPAAQAPKRRTKVAIVGFAPHWHKANFEDEDTEIWALNELYDVATQQIQSARKQGRLRWFEIHIREVEYEGNPFLHSRNKSNEHAAKMAALGCPVYMQRHWDDIPMSVPYPKDAVIAKYGRYFTNSISWMIALAIEEGFTEIGLYGVDMATTTEYGYERPSCEYMLGWVKALGIRLVMPPECDLLQSAFLYGFEADKAGFARAKLDARKQDLRGKRHQIENEIERLRLLQHQLIGAEEDLNYVKEVTLGNYAERRAPQA